MTPEDLIVARLDAIEARIIKGQDQIREDYRSTDERLRALETAVAVLAANRYAAAKWAAGVSTVIAALIAAIGQFFSR